MSAPTESTSGIKTAEDGSRYAGGSTRKDGSVRKIIRIRAGYAPLEDVRKFVPRARRLHQGNDEGAIIPRKESADKKVDNGSKAQKSSIKEAGDEKIKSDLQTLTGRGSADEMVDMLSKMSINNHVGQSDVANGKENKARDTVSTKNTANKKPVKNNKEAELEKLDTHINAGAKQDTEALTIPETKPIPASKSKEGEFNNRTNAKKAGSSGPYIPPSRRKQENPTK